MPIEKNNGSRAVISMPVNEGISKRPCPEEILRAFISDVLDEMNPPFMENLTASRQDDWLAIRYYLGAVEERLEKIQSEEHH